MFSDAHFRIREIMDASMAELALMLDEPEAGKPLEPTGMQKMSRTERIAHAEWLLTLTPRQRLELARDGVVRTK